MLLIIKAKSIALSALPLLLLVAPPAGSAMYKWIDEEGNVNYSQSPPPDGTTAEQIKPPPSVNTDDAREKLEQRQSTLNELRENRLKSEQEQAKAEKEKAEKQAKCDQARARLASYERPRVSYVNEDGTRSRATEEQRQSEIAKSREAISRFCN